MFPTNPIYTMKSAPRLDVTLFLCLLSLFIVATTNTAWIGLADNGDFTRSIAFLLERPLGNLTNWPESETEAFKDRFFERWHDKWLIRPNYPDFLGSPSSYQLYLAIQVLWSRLVSGEAGVYSVVLGGILSRIISAIGFVLLVSSIRSHCSTLVVLVSVFLVGLLVLDVNFAAFFNSFYQEQIGFTLTPLMGFSIYCFAVRTGLQRGVIVLLLLAVIGSAKTAYCVAPALGLLFLMSAPLSWQHRLVLIAIGLVAQSIAFVPVALGPSAPVNRYHALYYGVLKIMTPAELKALPDLGGKRIVHDCVGVPAFDKRGSSCIDQAQATYGDAVRLMLTQHQVAYRMFLTVFDAGRNIELDYLGKDTVLPKKHYNSLAFTGWTKIFTNHLNAVALGLTVILAVAVIWQGRWRRQMETALAKTALFLSVFGFALYGTALGDGFYEITKHLILGNYIISLSLVIMPAAWFSLMSCNRKS